MAMRKCKECGNDVSTKAKACPSCGAKQKRPAGFVTWFFVLVIFGGVVGAIVSDGEPTQPKSEPELSPEVKVHVEKFGPIPERLFDNSVMEVHRHLRKTAHDPSSIEFESCRRTSMIDTGWLVGCVYRGKNAFNATIKDAKWFTVRAGRVVKVDDADAYKW